MNEWDQRIREHRVWNEMKTLGPLIDSAISTEDLAPETIAGLERLRIILAYGGKRLAAAEPLITHPQSLESIAINFELVQNELTAFISDKDAAHIINANIGVDGVLLPLTQLPGLYSPEELGELVEVATDYRAIVQRALASTKQKLEQFNATSKESLSKLNAISEENLSKLSARLDESAKGFATTTDSIQTTLSQLAATIQLEQQKLAQIVTDQQGQFSLAQEARGKEFTDSLRISTQELTKLVSDYQGQFSTGQDIRSKEFALSESTRQAKHNEVIAEYNKKLADQDAEFTKKRTELVQTSSDDLTRLTSEYENRAKEILEVVQERQKHVEKLVGVIGNLGVTSGYLKTANQAKYAMWFWQFLTVTALVMLSWLAYHTLGLLEDSKGQFNWGGFAGRVLLLTSLGVIAAYSGSQADKLFGDERRNRKLALELAAIGPYLAPLPVEEQHKFLVDIGQRSFGRDHDSDPGVRHKSPASVVDLLNSKHSKDVMNLIVEAAIKAKDSK